MSRAARPPNVAIVLLVALALLSCSKKKPAGEDDDIANNARPAAHHPCAIPDSLECNLAHVTDREPLARNKAIDGVEREWKDVEGKPPSEQKKFKDRAVDELAKAYTSELLGGSNDDQKRILQLLQQTHDARAKPAFVYAIREWKPEANAEAMKVAARAIAAMAGDPEIRGDSALGEALADAVAKLTSTMEEPATLLGDALAAVAAPSSKRKLLELIKLPNDGADSTATHDLTLRQKTAARALGAFGDASDLPVLIDAMFDTGSKMTRGYPSYTLMGSFTAQTLSRSLRSAIARIGRPAIEPLSKYALDDRSDPAVKAVAEKFKDYLTPIGVKSESEHAEIAAQGLSEIGLGDAAAKLDAAIRDDATTDEQRARLLAVLIELPSDAKIIDAMKVGYSKLKSPEVRDRFVGWVPRTMEPLLVDWLIDVVADKKSDDAIKLSARDAIPWLAPKEKLEAVQKAFDGKTLATRDVSFRAREATTQPCPTYGNGDADCGESPLTGLDVVFKDVTPTYKEELALISEVLVACEAKGSCYLDQAKTSLAIVDKQTLGGPDGAGARAMIKLEKSLWMLAVYGSEADMLALVALAPTMVSPVARTFATLAVDRNLKTGSVKVADAIDAMLRTERGKGATDGDRVSAFEPVAFRLRTRATK